MSQQGYGRGDNLGTWAPIGSSGSERDLIRMPQKAGQLAPLADMFVRSRILKDRLPGYYGLAASLIGNWEPGQAWIINMQAAALARGGFARNEFLMGLSKMLVPSAMPTQSRIGEDSRGRPPEVSKRAKKDGTGDDE